MRLVFVLWEALSFHGLPVEDSPGVARAPRTRSRGIDENAWRRAFVEKCVSEKSGRAARVNEA